MENIKNKKLVKLKLTKGFTLVETMISLAIAILVLFTVYKFLASTRQHYMYGTVNLQNLQEARLAINSIRRDFSCACPKVNYPPSALEITGAADVMQTAFENLQKLRKQIFMTSSYTNNDRGELIQVGSSDLCFYTYVYGGTNEKPKVEQVRYNFDPSAKTLTRLGGDGSIRSFTGFENVLFELYIHELNPTVPILWVRFKIHEGEKYGDAEIGSALELTTSISSPHIASSLSNNYWRYETGHE
jgi:type II secretory pathway pseudopilin PulG